MPGKPIVYLIEYGVTISGPTGSWLLAVGQEFEGPFLASADLLRLEPQRTFPQFLGLPGSRLLSSLEAKNAEGDELVDRLMVVMVMMMMMMMTTTTAVVMVMVMVKSEENGF